MTHSSGTDTAQALTEAADAYRFAVYRLAQSAGSRPFRLEDIAVDTDGYRVPDLLQAIVHAAFAAGGALRERGLGADLPGLVDRIAGLLGVPDDRRADFGEVARIFLADTPESAVNRAASASGTGLDNYLHGMCALTVATVRLISQWDEVSVMDAVLQLLPARH